MKSNGVRCAALVKAQIEAGGADKAKDETARQAFLWLHEIDTARDLEAIREEMVACILKLRE